MHGNGRVGIRLLAVLAAAVFVAALFSACGGSGSQSGSDQLASLTGSPLLEFGEEAGESELEEAKEAVSDFLAARSKKDWEATCAHLSKAILDKLEHLATTSTGLEDTSCPAFLEAFVRLSPQEQRESPEIDVATLRNRGTMGYLIYAGEKEVVYAMPLEQEGGEWKATEISPRRLG